MTRYYRALRLQMQPCGISNHAAAWVTTSRLRLTLPTSTSTPPRLQACRNSRSISSIALNRTNPPESASTRSKDGRQQQNGTCAIRPANREFSTPSKVGRIYDPKMAKLWADTPMSLISETGYKERSDIPPGHFAITAAQNMAHLHNVIIRGFNASYNQCLAVKPDTVDASDFLFYNQGLYKSIKSHHDVEEDITFPSLVKLTGVQDIMDKNIQEHKDFDHGLELFRTFVFETDPKSYDGKKLQEIMDIMFPILHTHLVGEIGTLLDLAKYDSKKLEEWWADTSKKARGDLDVFQDAPLMLGCIDSTFRLDGDPRPFPPIPAPIKYLSKYVLEWRYSGRWRFNPCDTFGKPRPLAFPNPGGSKL
ncbi:hypothetical protein GX51_02334 [Blastomyces parvus]|uniref:Hemerythrin-like domain-containing protein n=1 Tax=Blastomyces parvus TaxID=2060905 RepID=A0A2B7XC94_9EURO|nr:hypothetical protein GX51_02334 [Blastomyces parvus]